MSPPTYSLEPTGVSDDTPSPLQPMVTWQAPCPWEKVVSSAPVTASTLARFCSDAPLYEFTVPPRYTDPLAIAIADTQELAPLVCVKVVSRTPLDASTLMSPPTAVPR